MRRSIAFLGFILLSLNTLSVEASLAEVQLTTQAPAPGCGEPESGSAPVMATLSLAEGESTRLDFGRSRKSDTLEIQVNVEGCTFETGKELRVKHRQFRRDGAAIPNEKISVSAVTERDFVILLIKVDPKGVHPGLYTANVGILDDKANTFRLPVQIGVQFDRWQLLALVVALLVLSIGTYLVWASSATAMFPSWKSGGKVLFGIAAAAGVFYGTFWRDSTWGADASQFFTLVAASITAYMASLTASNVATAAGERRTEQKKQLERPE